MDGTSFDEATGEYILTFRDDVPKWFLRHGKPKRGLSLSPDVKKKAMIAGAAALLVGLFWGGLGYGIIFGFIASLATVAYLKPGALRKAGQFEVSIRANPATGQAEFVSEWRKAMFKDWREPVRFRIANVATVERRSYAKENPESVEALAEIRENKDQIYTLEQLVLVFDDGQETPLGWQNGSNAAAIMQRSIIDLLKRAREQAVVRQRAEQQISTLAPGDAPL